MMLAYQPVRALATLNMTIVKGYQLQKNSTNNRSKIKLIEN